MTTYANSRGAALEQAYRHWRERGALLGRPPLAGTTPSLTIAVSRQIGAGGSEIASAVANELDWPLYDREIVAKISEDSGVRAQLLEQLDEKRPNWFAECVEGFSEERHMSGAGFAIHLRRILVALYCHGDCVILGRGGAQILPTERTLRVRITAPRIWRVEQVARRVGSADQAERLVKETDRARDDFVKSYFHKDPTNVFDYDLTLNASRFNSADCAAMITAALHARQRLVEASH